MRNIKFLIYDKSKDDYIGGNNFETRITLSNDGKLYRKGEVLDLDYDNIILEFYTGYKDSNNNYIHENELIKYFGRIGLVTFSNNGAVLKFSDGSQKRLEECLKYYPCEIVGVIHWDKDLWE